MRLIILVCIILLITGCSAMANLLESGFEKGREVNDKAVKGSIYVLCEGASLRAIKDEFNTQVKEKSRSDMCIKVNATVPIILVDGEN